jgi:hypothetical protein
MTLVGDQLCHIWLSFCLLGHDVAIGQAILGISVRVSKIHLPYHVFTRPSTDPREYNTVPVIGFHYAYSTIRAIFGHCSGPAAWNIPPVKAVIASSLHRFTLDHHIDNTLITKYCTATLWHVHRLRLELSQCWY